MGAVIVRDGSIVMVKRGREPARGLWSIPGGRLEGGESIADAVTREVREETGLEVEVGGLLGVFEVIGEDHFVILDHLASVAGDQAFRAGDDAGEARWVPLDELEDLDCTPRFVETLRGWGILG